MRSHRLAGRCWLFGVAFEIIVGEGQQAFRPTGERERPINGEGAEEAAEDGGF